MTAVSVPSPVVAWSDRITWPDCSPPSLWPPAFIASSTYRSPTLVCSTAIRSRTIAWTKPRLLITVATTVSLDNRPLSRIASARIGEDLVAVDELTVRVDRQAAVGVAVEGDAQVGAVADHLTAQTLQVGGSAVRG